MPDLDNVVEACQNGAVAAWRKYERWVGNRAAAPLCERGTQSIPESLLQAVVAETLYEHVVGVSAVSLEQCVRDAGESAWPADSRRIDVVAWSKGGKPRFLVELKRGLASGGLQKQFEYCNHLASHVDGDCRAIAIACKRFVDEKEAEKVFTSFGDVKPIVREVPLRHPSTSPDGYRFYGVAVYVGNSPRAPRG